jgi:hypothetical protein|tara:strand:+ start:597 stop:740 length:144 start_codon:yes stop_codon:yes gene_type:complete
MQSKMDQQDQFFGEVTTDMYSRIADVKEIATEKMQASTDEVKNTFTS